MSNGISKARLDGYDSDRSRRSPIPDKEQRMSRGKYLSLEEARKAGRLEQLGNEHTSEVDNARCKSLLEAMS